MLGLIQSSSLAGVGVVGAAIIFLFINFYDGVKRISRTEYHRALIVGFVAVYLFFSIRVVEMAWNFRGNAVF